MPLGFESSIAAGMAAMGELYGDRLVNQIAQAGQQVENGLKQVTTFRELKSLGSELSQISPETPDYQQRLIQLGASHPFAMQDPRGQALISLGNQAHLNWQKQQQAIQIADRVSKRQEAHDVRMLNRQQELYKLRYGGTGGLDFNNIAGVNPNSEAAPLPPSGFSFGAGMSGTSGPVARPEISADSGDMNTAIETATPPAGFSGGRGFGVSAIGEQEVAAPEAATPTQQEPDIKSRMARIGQALQAANGGRPLPVNQGPRLLKMALDEQKASKEKQESETRDIIAKREGVEPIGQGLYEGKDGSVMSFKQSAKGKWYLTTPPADHSGLPEFDENGYGRIGNTIIRRDPKTKEIQRIGTKSNTPEKLPQQVSMELSALRRQADLARRHADKALAERDANPNDAAKQALATRLDMIAIGHEARALEAAKAAKTSLSDENVIVISPDGKKFKLPKTQLDSAIKQGYTTE